MGAETARKLIFDFVGTHSSGKTTLMLEFQKYLDSRLVSSSLVPSATRTHLKDRELFLYDKTTELQQAWISLMNWTNIFKELMDYQVVLSTDLGVRSAAYTIASDECRPDFIGSHKSMIRYFRSWLFRSSVTVCWVYLPIEFPLVIDGVRKPDEKYRAKVDSIIRDLLEDYSLPYVVLTGSVEERLNKLIFVYKVLSSKETWVL